MAGLTRPTNEVLGRLSFLANTRGIIPNPVNAARVSFNGGVDGIGLAVIYTVPTGKLLFINSGWINANQSVQGVSECSLFTRNGADVTAIILFSLYMYPAGYQTSSNQYLPAIEVPAGYDVCVASTGGTTGVRGGIHGWIEDV